MRQLLRILARLRLFDCLLYMERAFAWRRQAVVLLFHHIAPDNPETHSLSQVEDGTPVRALDIQLNTFRRWYAPCSQEELAAAPTEPNAFRRDLLAVTFDDGYLSNRTLAGPILRKYKIPAIVFLPTGYIDSTEQFWWVRLNDIIRQFTPTTLRKAAVEFTYDATIAEILKQGTLDGRDLRRRLATRLECLDTSEVSCILDALESFSGKPSETCLPLVTWRDAREMRQEGFEFGAHTVTHQKMSRLSSHEKQQEISLCIAQMQEHLSDRPLSLAYPYGDYDVEVLTETRTADIILAYTAKPGAVGSRKISPLELPRIQLAVRDWQTITAFIFLLKLGKYFPNLVRPLLTRFVGEPFEL